MNLFFHDNGLNLKKIITFDFLAKKVYSLIATLFLDF